MGTLTRQLILEELEKVDWMDLVTTDANNRKCNYIINWHLTLELKSRGYVVNTNLVNTFLNKFVKKGLLTKKAHKNYCTIYTLNANQNKRYER